MKNYQKFEAHKTVDFTEAIRDGKIVNIKEVENGIKCNCFCPSCEQPLIAFNNPNNKNAHHFQHQSLSRCQNYYETMIHYWAKEIINELGELIVPHHSFEMSSYARSYTYYRFSENHPFENITPKKVVFDKIYVEKQHESVRPDLICVVKDKQIHVEIAVTHFIDENKVIKIKELDVTSLEIDLSDVERTMQKEELRRILSLGDISRMKWFNNKSIKKKYKSKQEDINTVREFINNNVNKKKTYGRNNKVYQCPLENSENYLENCKKCRYLAFQKEEIVVRDWDNREIYDNISIGCIGHVSFQFDELLGLLGVII